MGPAGTGISSPPRAPPPGPFKGGRHVPLAVRRPRGPAGDGFYVRIDVRAASWPSSGGRHVRLAVRRPRESLPYTAVIS